MAPSKKIIDILIFGLLCLFGCKNEKITLGTQTDDFFYVENKGAKMPVLVRGNTTSGAIVLWVHGGPGGTAIGFQHDEASQTLLEPNFAVAYWDQRAAGSSQGSITPKLELSQYGDDLKKVIAVLKHRYGSSTKIFLLSHSWGGLVAPCFLTNGENQKLVQGWINVAGAHNYYLNDSLTREYLIKFGNEQIALNIHKSEWESIVTDAINNPPNYTLTNSTALNKHANNVDKYIDDINASQSGGLKELLLGTRVGFSVFWTASNAASTQVSDLPKDIMYSEYSSKLKDLNLPILCITGKYDFVCPRGLADEVMLKVGSTKKKLVILQHSGHICMDNEPNLFYNEVLNFVKENL